MPYSKEQLKAYYEANKAKLNQQRSKRRRLSRLGQVEVETPERVETTKLENIGLRQVEAKEKVETEKEMSQPKSEVETIKLWTDYYTAKKPYCYSCIQKGIKETDYAFCSEKQIALNNYVCLVKHWTIYQGQNKIIRTQQPP
ncbi:hypothetical protein [endosymbiont GvMRE of Glomus versiforme]|uniref:hypothetical protein n=1 Tax=endosymbiont GvMRE of Glomus versiforme TaxID=2039283 RepID=UPI000EE7D5CE|nr:hypothetical protein [endosymbiont GvMRE of Glomus versiforme]RHZ36315.1 hypothetical protein GvMRE_Ic1g44 [endosymbiont GvMRE of Glomus versiforme]RHZ37720.1 hypothetical protein GvMRE_I1g686 [endosymbiont GvMRE of Glomus versiforme]